MPTFVSAPGVKVYIQTEKNGLIDVSEDLIEGNMVRRSDGISTFDFTVNNPQRKYDNIFAPNDRIVVVMKRLAWMRTFTGLLNSVPLVTAWPRPVSFSASCSLKRLLYWYWDSHAVATQTMISNAIGAGTQADPNQPGDVNNLILVILDKVVGWPSSKVHLAKIPKNWMDIAYKVAQEMMVETPDLSSPSGGLLTDLNVHGVISGQSVGNSVTGTIGNGYYGGAMLKDDQLRNAEIVYTVCKQMGGSDKDALIGLITAMDESTFRNLPGGDRDSVGMFQQRPSQGWGTPAQCIDPNYSSRKFFDALLKVTNRNSMQPWQAAQTVQRSGTPDGSNYRACMPVGEALMQILNQTAKAGTPAMSASATTAPVPGSSTGTQLAQFAIQYVEKFPNIAYSQQGGSDFTYLSVEPPPLLDCGTFVVAMYQRVTGKQNGIPRTVSDIDAWVASHGGKKLSTQDGLNTAGACMIKTGEHIEISVGNGHNTVGAQHSGVPAKVGAWDQWDHAVLLPGISYDGQPVDPSVLSGLGDSTGSGGSTTDTTAPVVTAASNLPGYNANDPFDKLFGNTPWIPDNMNSPDNEMANMLVGIRALLNDQPLLPYLMALFNSQMRSFCSAPNGDLIAWFPDYYGIWGVAAKMIIEPIEVQDFNVDWSDDSLVTHQFTLAGAPGMSSIDVGTGQGSDQNFSASTAGIYTQTVGVASIDIPSIMSVLFGIDPSADQAKAFADFIYKRFGARPNYSTLPGLQGPKAEFFAALFQFMRQWAYQYKAEIPLTFMPEIYPGMLIQIPAFNFQAYVVSVSHNFRFGKGGMFSTSVNVTAPAQMPKADGSLNHVLMGMPMAGGFDDKGFGNIVAAPSPSVQAQRMDDVHHGGGQGVTR